MKQTMLEKDFLVIPTVVTFDGPGTVTISEENGELTITFQLAKGTRGAVKSHLTDMPNCHLVIDHDE